MTERRQANNVTPAISRQEHKEQKEIIQEQSALSMSKSSIKMLFIRLFAVLLLIIVAAVVGSMIGFGVIGVGNA
ncbi:MAG: hypothetical protein RR603_06575, partial [Kurthia sp.]